MLLEPTPPKKNKKQKNTTKAHHVIDIPQQHVFLKTSRVFRQQGIYFHCLMLLSNFKILGQLLSLCDLHSLPSFKQCSDISTRGSLLSITYTLTPSASRHTDAHPHARVHAPTPFIHSLMLFSSNTLLQSNDQGGLLFGVAGH